MLWVWRRSARSSIRRRSSCMRCLQREGGESDGGKRFRAGSLLQAGKTGVNVPGDLDGPSAHGHGVDRHRGPRPRRVAVATRGRIVVVTHGRTAMAPRGGHGDPWTDSWFHSKPDSVDVAGA